MKDSKPSNRKQGNSHPGQYNIPNSQSYSFTYDVAPGGQLQSGPPGQQQVGFSRPDQPGTSVMGLEGSEK